MTGGILAIDTSTPTGSIALYREGVVEHTVSFEAVRSHNSLLFGPLQEMLENRGDFRAIVVGTGPGSYTGVRIGISAAIGVSLARELPLLGWPSVGAVMEAPSDGRYAVAGDARRGAWFLAEVEEWRLVGEPVLVERAEVERRRSAGKGPVFTFDRGDEIPELDRVVPAATALAAAVSRLSDKEVVELGARPVEPIYLRAPYITTPKSRK